MYKYTDEKKKHLHTLNDKPLIGTSSVLSVVAKPLTWWASGLACEKFGWLSDKKHTPEAVKLALEEGYKRVTALSLDDYDKLLKEAYKAHSVKLNDSAQSGTDMHAELEAYVKNCLETSGGKPYVPNGEEHNAVTIFANWAIENVEEFLWSEAHVYSEKMWTGGITDCGAKLKTGQVGIIDFKSSKEAYVSQFWQCAGYALQIEENGLFDANGKELMKVTEPIDFYAIVPFGSDNPEPVFDFNVSVSKEAFLAALTLYKITNNTKIDK